MKFLRRSIGVGIFLMLAVCFLFLNASAATLDDLTYEIQNKEVTITDCDRDATGELEIPDKINGYPVTRIADYAFWDCMSLTSVTIPDSVIYIGYCSFAGCINLESVTIPDSIISISDYAFNCCYALTSVQIPDGIDYIGESAFGTCTDLQYIVFLGDMPKHMNSEAFYRSYDAVGIFPSGNNSWENALTPKTAIYPESCDECREYRYTGYGMDWYEEQDPVIVAQPVIVSVDGSTGTTLQVRAYGDGLIYQWYEKKVGSRNFSRLKPDSSQYGVANIISESTYSFEAGSVSEVYCLVTDATGTSIKSNNVILIKNVSITTQPKTAYAQSGAKVSTTVKAVGDGLTYTWYLKNSGSSSYSKSSITGATYSTTMSSASKDRYVYCIVKDKYGNSVKSNTVLLRMAATITTQPKTAYAKYGAKVSTTVKAAGDGLKYTWYIKNAGQTSYSKSSITSSTYSTTMNNSSQGRYVYCVVTDKYGKTAKTNTVQLRMKATVLTQPKTTYAKSGATARVSVKAEGVGLKYEWYIKNANGTSYSKSSITSSTYSCTMDETRNGRYLICYVSDQFGNRVKCDTVRLRMAATITTQPKSVTVAKGSTAKVTLKAAGDGLKYTWYYKDAGATKFTKTTAFTGNTYSVPMTAARNGKQVYCVVTDKYGKTAKSNTVTLNMK